MQTSVLLSIKPEFAERILDGTKHFEFRRSIFKDRSISRVLIYASSPISSVIGEFEIDGVLSMSMHELWKRTRHGAGISWSFFSEYFQGKSECHAIRIKNPIRYSEPFDLEELNGPTRAPQSFAYVNSEGIRANKGLHLDTAARRE